MTPSIVLAFVAVLGLAVAVIYFSFHLRFARWKLEYTRAVRRDAIQRSQSATVGKVSEQLVPYFPQFQWNPKDARFVGAPIDFLIFDGLSEGHVEKVVFVEVKTGLSALNARERMVRDAIVERRVEWRELHLPDLRWDPAMPMLARPGAVRTPPT